MLGNKKGEQVRLKKNTIRNALAFTNPLIIPIGAGCLCAAIIASVFGGTYQNIKKIVRDV